MWLPPACFETGFGFSQDPRKARRGTLKKSKKLTKLEGEIFMPPGF